MNADASRRFAQQMAALREVETDDAPDPHTHDQRITDADNDRRAHGSPPVLRDDELEPPEAGFYRRARALGLRRHRG